MNEEKGVVFKIQRYSLHDGPGIRTLLFLKGCPLRCWWCFNPESQSPEPEIIFYREKCINCKQCVQVCPILGCIKTEDGINSFKRELCIGCGKCVNVCPTGAMTSIGELMEVSEVMKEIEKDRPFYDKSGGGVTVSGGEPFMQPEFTRAVLKKCKEEGINTAVETCGFTYWDNIERAIEYIDMFFFDLKEMDTEKHRKMTGVSNKLILENAKKLAACGKKMIIRMPIIPGCNDELDDLKAAARFIAEELETVKEVHLLPYELVGVSKYERMQREYMIGDIKPPSQEAMEELKGIFEDFKLQCQIGG